MDERAQLAGIDAGALLQLLITQLSLLTLLGRQHIRLAEG